MLPLSAMTATASSRELEHLQRDLERIAEARHHDPHAVLGRHVREGRDSVLVFLPAADRVHLDGVHPATRVGSTDFFHWSGPAGSLPPRYTVSWHDARGGLYEVHDPYCFPPLLSEAEIAAFNSGLHRRAYRMLGAHVRSVDGIEGVQFAVWAPNAERVSVVGPFNLWEDRKSVV